MREIKQAYQHMDTLLPLDVYCKTALTWRSNKNNSLCKTLITNPSKTPMLIISSSSSSSSLYHSAPLHSQSFHHQSHANPQKSSTKRTTLLVETFHENHYQRLKVLIEKLEKKDSSPLEVLKDDGDWSKDHFWAVIRFLKQTSRSKEVLQVFDLWKNAEKSRINEFNYKKIIGLLGEVGLMEEAVSALREMKSLGLRPCLEIYNSVIHGFAKKGMFDDALFYLKEMEETNLKPDTETYDGLIQAYGNYKMYDEIGKCVKKMESDGCLLDHVTYNLLIREFSRGGLLKRMERVYQTVLSKRMDLQSSTLVAMLEVYANLRILEKMEKVYRRVLNSKTPLKEDLIRKLAGVYIENYMFSRLDDLGLDHSLRNYGTELVWCLRLLSHACLLSRKGMDSIVQEMEVAKFSWNITVANVILLAYLKMKDFKNLKILLSELPARRVKPDIVTVGILFDASGIGFDGTRALSTWRTMGFFVEAVEMNTDPLVLTAFGKGRFLRSCEEMFSSLEPKARENKVWTYHNLIDLVFKHNGMRPQLTGVQ